MVLPVVTTTPAVVMVFVPVIFNVAFACVAAADLVAAVLSKMMKQTQAVSMAGLMTVNADVVVFLEAAKLLGKAFHCGVIAASARSWLRLTVVQWRN